MQLVVLTHYSYKYAYDKMVEVFLFFLLPPLLSLVPLLAWPIPLFIVGVLAWLVSIVILLTGMVSICGCELLHALYIPCRIIDYLLESAFSEYYMTMSDLVRIYRTLENFRC